MENRAVLQEFSMAIDDAKDFVCTKPPPTRFLLLDVVLVALIAFSHAAGTLLVQPRPRTASVEWEWTWGLYAMALLFVCVCSWHTQTPRPMLLLAWTLPYTLASISNTRTAMICTSYRDSSVLAVTALQLLLGCVLLLSLLLRKYVTRWPSSYEQLRAMSDEHSTSMNSSKEPVLPAPNAYASILGRITYEFMTPFVWRQYFQPTTLAVIPQLPLEFRSSSIVVHTRTDSHARTSSLQYRLWIAIRRYIRVQLGLSFCRSCLRVAPIACLNQLIGFMAQRDRAKALGEPLPPMHMGILWAILMFVLQMTEFLLEINVFQSGRSAAIQMRAYLSTELFSKILRRRTHYAAASDNRSDGITDGHIASLLSVDTARIETALALLHQPLVDYPLTILFCSIYLFRLLGLSALVGLSVLAITAPLQTHLSKKLVKIQDHILHATDARLNLANEVLMCIKTVKFFAWEQPFLDRMQQTRARELRSLAWNNMINVIYNFIFVGVPMFVTLVAFGSYTYVFGHQLTAQTAFTSLSILTTLRMPLSDLPELIVQLLGTAVSLRRIRTFLDMEETDKYNQLDNSPNEPLTEIGFDKATFSYFHRDPIAPVLMDLDCRFPVGKLSIVIGPVGAGKSSLLLAMLGELNQCSGHVQLPSSLTRSQLRIDSNMQLTESVAYCSQSPWLLGTSVRENILFGTEYDDERYHEVLRACALEPDLDILEFHDETEVGEKGTSLSGGQKARIALARAFYSHAKHILIDDALSAVDAHTAKHLHQHCFQGPLSRGRTIVLVTHATALLMPTAAYVVVLNKGRVVAQGAPTDDDVMKHMPEVLAYPVDNQGSSNDTPEALEERKKNAEARRSMKDIGANAESIQRRIKGLSLYWIYIRSVSKRGSVAVGLWLTLLTLYSSVRAADVSSNSWLKQWASSYDQVDESMQAMLQAWRAVRQPTPDGDLTLYYLSNYVLLVCLFVLFSTLRDLVQYFIALHTSQLLYARMLGSLLNARPRFFDITPIGRIMNRLSKDVETVDQEMTTSLRMMLESSVTLIAIISIICWATPKFLYMAGFVMVAYYVIGVLYLASSRDLKRIESIQRSPLFTLLGETLAGTVTVRAYGDAERVMRKCMRVVDQANRAFLYLWYENRWLSTRVDLTGSSVTLITSILLVLTEADAALTGFTLAYASLIVLTVLRIVRRYTMTEINLNAVERIQEYIDIQPEAQGGREPPAHWPTDTGAIHVQDLSVRYGKQFPLALQNVSFSIQPGEKVGIVGRTGSGKSTLSLAFFRFLEAERGSITIDGIDISTLSLSALRRKLTIIPQDSQLFKGTVRSNLDPFQLTEDADMWFALQRCQLTSPGPDPHTPGEGSIIRSLDDPVDQGGANFSAGQRQLLSLARGLLKMRDSKVLILDESTANLDSESDALIQRTIREQMAPGATILTVAHRLKTIIDYDKVLVLGQGKVVEFDSPHALLSTTSSVFYSLCERTGELDQLKTMARNHHRL
ncbi:Similar to S.cerevisiae protein YBT1 (Transporter of the ATP-binding cassette (ABC) family) [Malassezia sympodialis ATCC 42132]|uniref:Similar to S.cerevisiae protein YBT1 (Transporter of the ATP-binding cassette (ABC) family) n=1 Tax=Malassezia sympodialis (strain ATCC 42132) TaxID=1230383 RepID=A0A1M8A0C8_MALS4|nr:Similar to S.cerevisiae protein YBT1 (Transporter of the ATP-binding cassette (ABC) family) [Malassezia sympodialis ATCC 42132]